MFAPLDDSTPVYTQVTGTVIVGIRDKDQVFCIIVYLWMPLFLIIYFHNDAVVITISIVGLIDAPRLFFERIHKLLSVPTFTKRIDKERDTAVIRYHGCALLSSFEAKITTFLVPTSVHADSYSACVNIFIH